MPLILLAGALKAVEAIQQGCELYKEYKGTVLQAKETFDEAKNIAIEVSDVGTGIWDFIKSKLFPSDSAENKPPNRCIKERSDDSTAKAETAKEQETTHRKVTESVTNRVVEWDEQVIKKDLIKNLKIFFKAMIAIHKKIAQQQERIDHEVIDPDELLDVSLDLVVAKKEMEKAQKDIREVMVYQSPPELGALYSDVVEMFGIVQEKQEATHLLNVRKKRDEYKRRNNFRSKVRQRIAWVVVMALIVLEIWGLIAAILLARQPM